MAIQDVVDELAATIGAVTDMHKRRALEYPPDQIAQETAIIRLAPGGEWYVESAGSYRSLHNLIIEIYRPFKDLARDIEALMAYADSVPLAILADVTLGGSCDTYERLVPNGVTISSYAGVSMVLISWTLENIKIRGTL